MKNVTGKAVLGEDFFQRKKVISTLANNFENKQNTFLSGERFSGKTSMLKYFENLENTDFEFVYTDVSEAKEGSEYFGFLAKSVFKSKGVDSFLNIPKEGLFKVGGVIGKFAKASGLPFKFEAGEMFKTAADSSAEAFKEFFTEVGGKFQDFNIVVLVDGFPDLVRNIEKESGFFTAAKFLQTAHIVRTTALKNVTFIYSGAIGLSEIAERLDEENSLSDLKNVHIPTLGEEEALEFIARLFNNKELSYNLKTVGYLFEKIQQLSPYNLQIFVKMLKKSLPENQAELSTAIIDSTCDKLIGSKNKKYFKSYGEALENYFEDGTLLFSKELLKEIAVKGKLSLE